LHTIIIKNALIAVTLNIKNVVEQLNIDWQIDNGKTFYRSTLY